MSKKAKSKKRRGRATGSIPKPDRPPPHRPEEKESPSRSTKYVFEAIIAACAAIIVFVIYANSLDGPFVFDDENNIQNNSAIRLTSLAFDSLWSAGSDSPHPRRFVAYLSFALNYYFHQYAVEGYRVVNLLIHIITGVLIFYFTRITLAFPKLRAIYPRYREIAFFVAIIWLFHPMAAQSVAYIVQRMNSLSGLFYMLSLLLYVNGRRAVPTSKKVLLFSASALSGVLALGSKEVAATLPIFMLLYEWYFFQDLKFSWLKRNYLLIGSAAAIVVVIGLLFLGSDPLGGFDRRNFTLEERVLTESRVVFFYVSLLLFPHPSRLTINHDFSVSHGLLEPLTTLLSMVGLVGLFAFALYAAKRERLVSFCILWFFGNLVIESSIIPLELVFEHRTYIPSIGLFILSISLLYRFTWSRWLQVVPLGVSALVFCLWAHERSAVWADRVVFWADAAEKAPSVARLYNNLGVAHEEKGELDEALANYVKAASLDRGFYRAWNNIGLIYLEKKDYDEAIRAFSTSMQINPNDVDAYKGFALTYHAMKDRAKYLEYLERVRAMEGLAGQ